MSAAKKIVKIFEHKTIDAKKSEDGNTGYIVGYPSVFGNMDSYRDIIVKGAFLETIKNNPHWNILRFHLPNRPIGMNKEAAEDNIGLRTTAAIALNTQDGKDQYHLSALKLEIGGLDARSIGFIADEYTYKKDSGGVEYRELSKIDLWEDSFVTWGANDKAGSTEVREHIKLVMGLDQDFGLKENLDRFFRFMEDLGYKHTEVKEFLLREETEKKALSQLAATAREAMSILKK